MEENNNVETQSTDAGIPTAEKTFTQKEVNDLVQNRLSKSEKSLFTKLGINSKEELDSLVEKLRDYDTTKNSNAELTEKVSKLENEKARAQYIRAIEKENVDDEVIELVYSKVVPNKDEDVKDYASRVKEYLKEHSNFVKNTSVINTSVNLSGGSTIGLTASQRMNNLIRRKE